MDNELTTRQKTGLWVGAAFAVIPGLIVAGFFPDFNVLPTWIWLLIATIGSAVGGSIAASRMLFGALTGGLAGLGAVAGILGYIEFRSTILPTESFMRLEIAIGALLGAAPGMASFFRFAK